MYQQIEAYLSQDIYPFHMPGHKRNRHFFPSNLERFDLTEIPGMDVLSAPAGILKDMQGAIADFYGAGDSFFLVNGSSAGIVAAVCALCGEGAPLFVPRNAHVSVYNGMVLSGASPVYYMPEITADGLAGGVNPEVFDHMPEGATALVVSPTYEGFVSDIASISARVRAKQGVLIVDEAHGAHFPFHKSFPAPALSQGADIVINSLHKTLPALGQCAVLHINGKSTHVDREILHFYVNSVQTSSPSYILMTASDYMLRVLWENPSLFDEYIARLADIRNGLPGAESAAPLRLSGRERVGEDAIYNIDPGKLLFTLHTSQDAEAIAETMAKEYKIQMEMAKGRHILAMTSVADTLEGFMRLNRAVGELNSALPLKNALNNPPIPFALPEVALSPREALRRPSKLVPQSEAIGKISAELITTYPPGIALVAPGETLTQISPHHPPNIRVI